MLCETWRVIGVKPQTEKSEFFLRGGLRNLNLQIWAGDGKAVLLLFLKRRVYLFLETISL